ncbi:arsenical pump-driving ATPase [Ornithinimicrobium ciconiae]|uniref:Arsenical pump-driving ATPase n=1 Tax=Ornithinimicrobium ciconiae TaxID=2594265 RepID=A0A516G9C2_9MICO|nr:arsenical pump-driving ATPase [Ornithinimicrobium ciconiae]QDO88134.1 arsenical pump-driving ATPase [Ornithinimicrobium ciconiae]
MQFLQDAPQFLFFTGKGGVGKTSVACATAVTLAGQGKRVLLVSTDPASNVGQVFDVVIGNTITAIEGVPGLSALEIDPEQAAEAYRERIVGPVRGLLPDKELASITEQLSGSCTTEVASFNEFTAFLADPAVYGGYDHVLFDTAPTGHTVRLLQLPGSWTDFLQSGKGDASCLGPLAGLDKQRSTYAAAVEALKDPTRTRLVLVARAQTSSLKEIERTNDELGEIGIHATHVVINGVLPPEAGDEALAAAVRARETAALTAMPAGVATLTRDVIGLRPTNMVGLPALRSLLSNDTVDASEDAGAAALEVTLPGPLAALVDEIEKGEHGLVLCMGKGGVGKTTIAAAIAVELAHRGHPVHLTTTDPAAHLEETLHGSVTGLRVSRIDPLEATREYRDRVLATKGKNLDEAGRRNLAEDLLSPCTEEVAVFQQFSKAVHESRREFVVIDTAPTGHTLLLLDAAGSYHRDVARQMGDAMAYTTPLMRLQDPTQTKVLLITLAEPTPVTEAEVLQQDLERAGIHPWAWVINNSLLAARPESPFLQVRAQNEVDQVARVESLSDRVAVVPLLSDEPVGVERLGSIVTGQVVPV